MAAATASASSSTLPPPPTSYSARPAAPLKSKTKHRIDLAELTPNNVGQLRKLNSVLFPVRYTEAFYKDALHEDKRGINKLALFNDIPVGNIVCRFEYPEPSATAAPSSSDPPPVKIYIMTLGILAPYRRLGLASSLISNLLTTLPPGSTVSLADPSSPPPQPVANAKSPSTSAKKADNAPPAPKRKTYKVESVYLHVQTNNDEAREFYKRQGFEEGDVVEEYYRRGVEPRSAVLLEKRAS